MKMMLSLSKIFFGVVMMTDRAWMLAMLMALSLTRAKTVRLMTYQEGRVRGVHPVAYQKRVLTRRYLAVKRAQEIRK